jgi:hypothetical protein
MTWTQDEIDRYIRDHKDVFPELEPESNHANHFLVKLSNRFKKFVSIVPHLIKVLIVTVIIFACSIFVWYKFLKHPIVDTVIEKFETKK